MCAWLRRRALSKLHARDSLSRHEGGRENGIPSRAAHPSACSQPSRKLLMLSQPSSPPFALVVQTWVGPALCAPPFLEALFCARLHAQLIMSIQKHHSGDAQTASFGLSTAAAGVLLCAPDGSFLLVFGLSWLDFFRAEEGQSCAALLPATARWMGMRMGCLSISILWSVLWL